MIMLYPNPCYKKMSYKGTALHIENGEKLKENAMSNDNGVKTR